MHHIDTAHAETRYITDVLYIPMRSGAGNQYRILRSGLKSGTKLTVLEESEDGEWTKVALSNGQEGYVRNQYLISTPTAASRLNEALASVTRLEKERGQLKQQVQTLQTERSTLQNTLSSESTKATNTAAELEEIKRISADTLALNQRHQDMLQRHQLLQTDLDVLKAENERLKNDNRQQWFMYGVGAVLCGVILTLILPRLPSKRRNSEWAN
ncbi:signal transduction protein [Marinibactrum halimedae]|uniref:Signal transduction protein n=2 Tax=Marinibactrum halimedae TaxID=1444977 RepID=A0AA37T5P2_9GAMM|nr:TIGR04211 family SH3 domain-containing protein [Marinibactrum halimedae]GLS26116.1 signal transduction protein [Marinibactrum halimedae]